MWRGSFTLEAFVTIFKTSPPTSTSSFFSLSWRPPMAFSSPVPASRWVHWLSWFAIRYRFLDSLWWLRSKSSDDLWSEWVLAITEASSPFAEMVLFPHAMFTHVCRRCARACARVCARFRICIWTCNNYMYIYLSLQMFVNVSAESDLPCQVLLRSFAPKLPQSSQTLHLQRPQVWEPLRNWNERAGVAMVLLNELIKSCKECGICMILHDSAWFCMGISRVGHFDMAMAMSYDQRFLTSQAMQAASSQGFSWKHMPRAGYCFSMWTTTVLRTNPCWNLNTS